MGKQDLVKMKSVKNTTWLLLLAMVLSLFNGLIFPARTDAAPLDLIASVDVSPKQAEVGDQVELVVGVTSLNADAPGPLYVQYASNGTGSGPAIKLTKSSDGLFRGSVVIGQTAKTGLQQISGIDIMHSDGSQNEVYNSVLYPYQPETEDLSGGDFSISNPNQDITPPVVTSVSVDKRTVYLGESVKITARASDVGLGIDGGIALNYRNPSQSGRQVTLQPMGDGTYVGTLLTQPGEQIGTWFINSMSLTDLGGNHVTIDNSTRVPDSSFTKMNLDHCDLTVYLATGPDDEPPVIESLTLDKTQVTGGGTVKLRMKVSDQSGIEPLIGGAYHAPDYATNSFHESVIFKFSPPRDGFYEATVQLRSTPGNWLLSGFSVADLAGNETTLANRMMSVDGTGDDLSQYEVTVGFNVYFDTLGGSAVPIQFTTGYVKEPAAPTKPGLYFSGWYTNPTYTTRWDFNQDKVTASTRLYAYWVDSPDKVVVQEFPYFAKTTANSLNMRSGPTTWYPVKATIPKGTIVKVEFKDNNWFYIDHQGIKGYVSSTYILKANQDLIYQTKSSLNFRTGPSSAYSIIKKLPMGAYVELIAKTTPTWWKISVNGTIGYVSAAYLIKSAAAQVPEPIPVPTTQNWYIVKSPVNFRTGPGATALVINKLTVGTTLQLISKVDATWWKVSVKGQVGYISGKYVETVISPIQKYVNITALNLRTGPSTAYSVISKLPQGSVFTLVQKTSATWWRVTVNGMIGYTSATYLSRMPTVD